MVEAKVRQTVLFVDDDPDFLGLITLLFTPEDYEVLSASNASEALSILQDRERAKLPIDQLWIDNRMPPGMTGIELVQKLREKPQKYLLTSGMRIVLMSATMTADLKDEDRALFDGFLPKPFELQTVARLAENLRTRQLSA